MRLPFELGRKGGSSHRWRGPARLRLGYVPLCDCAPLVVAREAGFFERHGVSVELVREVGWATIREIVASTGRWKPERHYRRKAGLARRRPMLWCAAFFGLTSTARL
jgi:hypothetical protein